MSELTLFNAEFDVRTSFISLVDHLPSEITRKLWLIQTLDIHYNSLKDDLNSCLTRLQQNQSNEKSIELVKSVLSLTEQLKRTRNESLAEAKSISASIKLARLRLDNQHQQLEHDHKLYLNEIEMQSNLKDHAKRSNKRTSSILNRPPLKLTLNLKKSNSKNGSPARSKINKLSSTSSNSSTPKKNIRKLNTYVTSTPLQKSNKLTKDKLNSAKKNTDSSKLIQEDSQTDGEDHTLYCICKKESFGEMVACDNSKCTREWFHYGCVGLQRAPRGKWLCPICTAKLLKKLK